MRPNPLPDGVEQHMNRYSFRAAPVALFLFGALSVVALSCGDSGSSTGPSNGDRPTVRVTSPGDLDAIAGVFTVEADIDTSVIKGNNIVRIEVVVDGTPVVVDSVPYPAAWNGDLAFELDTEMFTEGSHSLVVRATDLSLNRYNSTSISLSVQNDIVFSQHIQPIFRATCAVSGCHDPAARQNELNLWTYEGILEGSRHGSVVVPGNAAKSPMMFFVDFTDDPNLRMPPPSQGPSLDKAAISRIRKWIDDGLRNDNGEEPFTDVTDRIFNTNQGADAISVIDRTTGLTVRVVPVGVDENAAEVPHFLITDNLDPAEHFYVTLITSGELWKFSATDYSLLDRIDIGEQPAHVILTEDGATAFVSNWVTEGGESGTIQVVDAATMSRTKVIDTGGAPHGMRITHGEPYKLFVGNSGTDNVTVVDVATESLVETFPLLRNFGESLNPLQIAIDRDDRYGYVACHLSHEVQVFDVETHEVVKRIDLRRFEGDVVGPFQVEVSPALNLVVVANQLNSTVSIISTDSLAVVRTVESEDFAQCHGVDISEDGQYAYITNENTDSAVPPHHPTETGGNPGNVAYVNLVTFLVDRVVEVEEDPTGISITPGRGN